MCYICTYYEPGSPFGKFAINLYTLESNISCFANRKFWLGGKMVVCVMFVAFESLNTFNTSLYLWRIKKSFAAASEGDRIKSAPRYWLFSFLSTAARSL